MTDWYVNINNTSGTEDGTSEATGWTDLNDVRANYWGTASGITGGDRLFIKAGESGATYDIIGSNVYFSTDENNMTLDGVGTMRVPIEIIGYPFDGTTSDIPMNDDRPLIYLGRNNGSSFYIRGGNMCSHLRFYDPGFETDNNSSGGLDIQEVGTVVRNCSVIRANNSSIGNRSVAFSAGYNCDIRACEVEDLMTSANWPTRDSDYNINFVAFSGVDMKGCVFKQQTPSYFFRWRNRYGAERFENCIFIGNDNSLGVLEADSTSYLNGYSSVIFDNCVFYNMGTAFKVPVPTAIGNAAQDTEAEWRNQHSKIQFNNCIFESNTKAIEVPSYTDPSGWLSGDFYVDHMVYLKNCVFAQNTTDIDGTVINENPIYASGSVFRDAANGDFRLNSTSGAGALVQSKLPNFEYNMILSGNQLLQDGALNKFVESVSQLSVATSDFDSSLALNSTITFEGSGKTWILASKPKNGIPVFRRA